MKIRCFFAFLIGMVAHSFSLRSQSEVLFEAPGVVHLRYGFSEDHNLQDQKLYLSGPGGEQLLASSPYGPISGTSRCEGLANGTYELIHRGWNIQFQKPYSGVVGTFQKSDSLWGLMEFSETVLVKTATLNFESVGLKPGLTLLLVGCTNTSGAFNSGISGGDLVELRNCRFRPMNLLQMKSLKVDQCTFSDFGVVTTTGEAAFSGCTFTGPGFTTFTLDSLKVDQCTFSNLRVDTTGVAAFSGCAFTGLTIFNDDTVELSRCCFTDRGANDDQEARVIIEASKNASVTGCDFLGGPVQLKALESSSLQDNVFAASLWIGPGPFPQMTGNSLLWGLGVDDNSSGPVSLSNNYWGGRRGPRFFTAPGQGWLDEYGPIYFDRFNPTDTVNQSGSFSVSGVKVDRPFPKFPVRRICWGQNVLSPWGTPAYVRTGRAILVCCDVRCTAESLPGAEYYLMANGRRINPLNPTFVARCDYGPADISENNQNRTLNFRLDPSFPEAKIEIEVWMDTSSITEYAPNPGKILLYSSTIHQYPAYARPIRLAIVPVQITAQGFMVNNLGANSIATCMRKFREDLLALTPLSQAEIDMELQPTYVYTGKQWGWRSFIRPDSGYISDLIFEMNDYRNTINAGRPTDPFDYVVAIMPLNSLSGADGASLGGINAVVVDELSPGAFCHELAHIFGAADSYSAGYLGGYGETTGSPMANHTAFHPEMQPAYIPGALIVPRGIRHFPAGIDIDNPKPDIVDLMGSQPGRYWILKTTHQMFGQFLGGLLGSQALPTPQAPIQALSTNTGTRRIWVEAALAPFTPPPDSAAYPLLLGAIPESIAIADVTGILSKPIQLGIAGNELSMKFRAYNAIGLQVFWSWGKAQVPTGQNTQWHQTFEVPTNSVRFEIVQTDIYGNPIARLFNRTSGSGLVNTFSGPPDGAVLGRTVHLQWSSSLGGNISSQRVRNLLFYSVDGQQTWQPMAVDRFENEIELPTDFLPATNGLALKLVSSDGFQTTQKVFGNLSMTNRPPTVSINAPRSGDRAGPEVLWTLIATASDPEDGPIMSGQWSSSRDGLLGTNAILKDIDLSSGWHLLRFIAMDREGHASSAGVQITAGTTNIDWEIKPEDLQVSIFGSRQTHSSNRNLVFGKTNILNLTVRNQGTTNQALLVLFLQKPNGLEFRLAQKTISWKPFEETTLQATFFAGERGNYRIRASLQILTDPEILLDNNQQIWVLANQAPVAKGSTVIAYPGRTAIRMEGYDLNGDTISYSVVKPPARGALSGVPPLIYYTSGSNAVEDSFTFRASDGELNSADAKVHLILLPNELSPDIISPISANAKPGFPFSYSIEVLNGATRFIAENLPNGLALDAEQGIISGTPVMEGTFYILLKAMNAIGQDQTTITLKVAKWPSEYASWVAQYQLTGPSAEYGADPDRDGLNNLIEYAWGLSPVVPNPNEKSSAIILDNNLTINYRQPKGGTGTPGINYQKNRLLYRVESSPALVQEPWTTTPDLLQWIPGHTIDLGDGYERISVRWLMPSNLEAKRFLRLVVEETAP